MQPLTTNDDDLLVYCDWLEDEGRSKESEDLREEIINPNVESWYNTSINFSIGGVGGGYSCVGSCRSQKVGSFGGSSKSDEVGSSSNDGLVFDIKFKKCGVGSFGRREENTYL